MRSQHTLHIITDYRQTIKQSKQIKQLLERSGGPKICFLHPTAPDNPGFLSDKSCPDPLIMEDFQLLISGKGDILILKSKDLPWPLPQEVDLIALAETSLPPKETLAIISKKGDFRWNSLFEKIDCRKNYGKLTLVGFGPGDPDLLTIAGDKALKEADHIFYDDLLDQEYVHSLGKESTYVGKRKGNHSKRQQEINELLVETAKKGKKVVRLKGGDPMIFAHGGEEIEYLRRHFIPVKVIPGITTASALAASSRISLTHRDISSSVALISGHSQTIQTPDADTLVYYMGASSLPVIARKLIRSGRAEHTPVLLVYHVSLPDEQEFFTTLGELQNDHKSYPTPLILLAGEVVALRTQAAVSIARRFQQYTITI